MKTSTKISAESPNHSVNEQNLCKIKIEDGHQLEDLLLQPHVASYGKEKWVYLHCSDLNTHSQGQLLPRGQDLLLTLILGFSGWSHSLG